MVEIPCFLPKVHNFCVYPLHYNANNIRSEIYSVLSIHTPSTISHMFRIAHSAQWQTDIDDNS